MAAQYGAHETMEIHEALSNTIDGINQFQLYRSHVQDPQLLTILDNQIQFMLQDYNNLVQSLNRRGMTQAIPYRTPKGTITTSATTTPSYGLQNPSPQAPNMSANETNDRDVSSGMLGFHKSSAILRTMAALECADPQLRRMMQQGSANCTEQAYEIWQYMHNKGYYQVPTMKDVTTNTVMNMYNPAFQSQMGQMGQLGQMSPQ